MERFMSWIAINEIPEEKKVCALITAMGPKCYSKLKSLSNGIDPTKMEVSDVNAIMAAHFEPKRLVMAERYKFGLIEQSEGESIRSFVLKLQSASENCSFGQFRDEALRDAFILKMRDPLGKIRPSLLTRQELNFKEAIETAEMLVSAITQSKEISKDCVHINKIATDGRNFKASVICYGCGETGHVRKFCREKNMVCDFCQARGHKAKACRKKLDSFKINHMSPFYLSVSLSGFNVTMEIDTGSPISIVNQDTFETLGLKLESTMAVFKCFNGYQIKPLGKCTVEFKTRNGSGCGDLFVTKTGPNIIGRDWLIQIPNLSIHSINLVRPDDDMKIL